MQNDDLTKPVPDAKYGTFEPDPSDPFVERYIPADSELDRINTWLKSEMDTAWDDDRTNRERKLRLLAAYRCEPDGKEQILILPLIKRAVRRNVAYAKGKILTQTPLVTVEPTSNKTIPVLVESAQFGTVQLDKSSEEIAQSLEWWLDWKLRSKINFNEVVSVAATEAKRGQTPTWIKVVHDKQKRTIKSPKFEKKGPLGITYNSKDDLEVTAGDPDRLVNVSTYSMLMPADEQDAQASRWLAQHIPPTSEELRRSLANGDDFLIDKKEHEKFIEDGVETALSDEELRRAAMDNRIPSVPKGKHDVWEVWFNWHVPMKSEVPTYDEDGVETTKNVTQYQEYSMVGRFHRKHGRLMSLVRNPFDHGMRPYVPVFDRKEPFRLVGESVAEDVAPYQKVVSELNSLEIRGGVVATTPVIYAEPGSVAGDWVSSNPVEPGSVIPRMRPEEIEAKTLGERQMSLLGLIEFHNKEFEKATSIGDLQLGLDVPGRTPASSIAQILNQGQTDAEDFVEQFCDALKDAIVLYVKTVQQYMRTGEVIPFDAETKAEVLAALEGEAQDIGEDIPVRFPKEPITDQFIFSMTAVSRETQQADFEKLVGLKKLVDEDGSILAQIIGPLASGQLPPSVVNVLIEHVTRTEKLMADISKSIRKDGDDFSIKPDAIRAIVAEMQQMQMMQQMAQNGAMNGPQGTQSPGGAGGPGVPGNQGGMGGPVPQPGVPPMPEPNQAGAMAAAPAGAV